MFLVGQAAASQPRRSEGKGWGCARSRGRGAPLLTPYISETRTSPHVYISIPFRGRWGYGGRGNWAEGCQLRPQLPASPRGARPLGEGVASAGSSVPLPRPRPSTWSRQVRPLPGSPGTEGDSLGVLGDNHRKRSSGRSWTGGLLEQTWGFFLEVGSQRYLPFSTRIQEGGARRKWTR